MKPKDLFSYMGRGEMPPRTPFVPTIYEHGAKVIGKTPSQVAQDEDLIVESQLTCYEIYGHDLVSVGLDIYNVECEALGAEIEFFDNENLPSMKEPLIKDKEDLKNLRIPNPEEDARMPLFLNATQRIQESIGEEVIVNGAVVGPFTLAALLRGFENYIMDLLFDEEFALELMDFAKEVGMAFAEAFLKRGVGLSINESWISPPLLSPDLYRDYVLPVERDLIQGIKKLGQTNVALISGGNTTSIAADMVNTGTSLLMADYNTDQVFYKGLCKEHGILLRGSIEAKTVENGDEDEMYRAAQAVIENCGDYAGFIFGCGVVSYDTSVSDVLKLKKIVQGLNNMR